MLPSTADASAYSQAFTRGQPNQLSSFSNGPPYFCLGWSQKRFSDNIFLGELDLFLGGVNTDIGVRK
jgi:hypothetical protein